jgi:hypothetical protein
MKILIAGDSYAASNGYQSNSWAEQLKTIGDYDITNIAYGGTSLPWTYKKLMSQNINDFDKVIVVVTSFGRGYTRRSLHSEIHDNAKHMVNYESLCKKLALMSKDDPLYDEFIAVKMYFEHIYDHELQQIYHLALIDRIKAKIPDEKLILINGCNIPPFIKKKFNNNMNMIEITQYELKNLNINLNVDFFLKYIDSKNHPNHMTPLNNLRVARYVKELIEGNIPFFNLDEYDTIDAQDLQLYYCINN